MMNTVARLMDAFLSPLNFLFFCALTATVLLFTARWRLGRSILSGLCVLGLGLMLFPVDLTLSETLENRFPQSTVDHVDGIVVLGGAANLSISLARHRPTMNGAVERYTELVTLMHRFPDAQIVFTGGTGDPFHPNNKEADIVRQWLMDMGADTSRIIFEDQSRNTRENAVFSKRLANPLPGQTWLLVTSAKHMPRSMGSFQAVDWPMVAWPVNYQTSGNRRDDVLGWLFSPPRIDMMGSSLHEVIGLIYYHLLGWTPTWFPAP